MNIAELMNYRFENPDTRVLVDSKITEQFMSRERSSEAISSFELWASISRERIEILSKLQNWNLEENKLDQGITR